MPAVKNVGEPCAGEPHARIDGGREETRDQSAIAARPRAPLAYPTNPDKGPMRKPLDRGRLGDDAGAAPSGLTPILALGFGRLRSQMATLASCGLLPSELVLVVGVLDRAKRAGAHRPQSCDPAPKQTERRWVARRTERGTRVRVSSPMAAFRSEAGGGQSVAVPGGARYWR